MASSTLWAELTAQAIFWTMVMTFPVHSQDVSCNSTRTKLSLMSQGRQVFTGEDGI